MKKNYVLAACIMAVTSINAQIIDFESFVLDPESYDNGSDESGGFQFGDAFFGNYYDTTYDYNTGFSITNKSDDTTAGYTNSQSAITASGDNSANYAMFYSNGAIDLTPIGFPIINSASFTNSTFAFISMRDGDSFGKQFGSLNGADGESDGTNGEDFFSLTVYSLGLDGDTIGFVTIMLADFKFVDNTKDYILDAWENFDLSALNKPGKRIAYLTFGFKSSDNGDFGMNTPAYFAMDNLSIDDVAEISENVIDEPSVYPNPFADELNLVDNLGVVRVYDMLGQLVLTHDLSLTTKLNTAFLAAGSYRLTVENMNSIRSVSVVKK
ncbi:MAG: hypothetical protein ACI9G9_001690 [Psychromonas sp.]|jgi:hypothetical protein